MSEKLFQELRELAKKYQVKILTPRAPHVPSPEKMPRPEFIIIDYITSI